MMPPLQPLTSEALQYRTAVHDDNASLDIRVSGFWGLRHRQAFFDVRVFNSLAPFNRSTSLGTNMKQKTVMPL